MSKNFTSWAQVQVGKRFIVKRNSNSHNYPMNTPLVVGTKVKGVSGSVIPGYNSLNIADVEFLEPTLEDLQAERKKLLTEIKEIENRISFMSERQLEVLPYGAYEAYQIVKKLKDKDFEGAEKEILKFI